MGVFSKAGSWTDKKIAGLFGPAGKHHSIPAKTFKKHGSSPIAQPGGISIPESGFTSTTETDNKINSFLLDQARTASEELRRIQEKEYESNLESYKRAIAQARDEEDAKQRRASQQSRNMSPLERFIHGELIDVVSSNVASAQFDMNTGKLYLAFKNGSWYGYDQISHEEAASFFNAGSKGQWVWDWLRIRGTVFGWRKPYAFMFNGIAREPHYFETQTWAGEHGAIPMSGEIPASWVAAKGPYSVSWLVSQNPKLFPKVKVLAQGVEEVGTFGALKTGTWLGEY